MTNEKELNRRYRQPQAKAPHHLEFEALARPEQQKDLMRLPYVAQTLSHH
jgi:hypothetical protein